MGRGGKPELGPVTGGRRVVELADMVGVRLGTEKEVRFEVGAKVGRVPDEAKVLERVSDELKLGVGWEALGTLLVAVLSRIVMVVLVVGSEVGMTETVEETVAVGGLPGLPALVRTRVLVPVVT